MPRIGIVDIYNAQADVFAAYAPRSFTWHHIERPAFDRHLQGLYRQDVRALDLGCGSGRITKHLVESGISAKRIIGVDGCEELLAIAKREQPNVAFKCQDIRQLNLAEDDFTLVTAHMVFQCFGNDDLATALRSLRDHMAVGGTLFFIVTHPLRELKDLATYLQPRWINVISPWGTDLPNYHRSISDYVNCLIGVGFRIEAMDELTVPEIAQAADAESYTRYAQLGAVRLAIKATK